MPEYAPLEAILRLCAAAAPVPWYPRDAAAPLGLTEPDLLAFVEQLRGGGLIARTDAVAGYGRGYVLTPLGVQALQDPGGLEWLRRGEIPPRKAPPSAPEPAVPERERAVRLSLLAPFTPRVTRALIAVNVAVFVWGVYLAHRPGGPLERFLWALPPDVAHRTGAVQLSDVVEPGWGLLRLMTCCFVHGGLIHLGANMISLYMIGPLVERMWGHVRFLVLYLVAGFGGSCAAVVLRPPEGPLVGASGALWGLLASLVVWIVLNRRHMPRRLFSSWGMQIAIVVVINVALTHFVPNISAEAHYGGAIVGAVCAVFLHFTRFAPSAVRVVAAAAVAALPLFGLYAVTHPGRYNPQWDRIEMEVVRKQVQTREVEALKDAPGAAADPLINTNPSRRDEGQVKKAVAAYVEAAEALRPAADLLRRSGPYRDAEAEKVRQVRLELVEARLALFEENKRCLEAGEAWARKDEERREAAIDRVRELEKEAGRLPVW